MSANSNWSINTLRVLEHIQSVAVLAPLSPYTVQRNIQVHLNKLECRGKVLLFQ